MAGQGTQVSALITPPTTYRLPAWVTTTPPELAGTGVAPNAASDESARVLGSSSRTAAPEYSATYTTFAPLSKARATG